MTTTREITDIVTTTTLTMENNQIAAKPPVPSLPPEIEEGNIEYKFKLVNPTDYRLEHLVTQMKWRLREGDGEAIYEIGVEDCGLMTGLSKAELDSSLDTLNRMAQRLEAETLIIREHTINNDRFAVEVLVRRIPDNQEFIDIRVACIGKVDAGKSTLLGVLCYGDLDNGRGRARLHMFRHLHEIQTGRTSSISHEILGFDNKGNVLNYSETAPEDICSSAAKIITLLDLAGHQKYMKTTIFGLTGCAPEIAMLVVAANRGLVGTTREHLGLVVALKIPFLIVLNKVDLCDAVTIGKIVAQLEKILKSAGLKKLPMVIEDEDDVLSAASNFPQKQVAPIFKVSSVTGENLTFLRSFFHVLPSLKTKLEQDVLLQQPTEFQVDGVFAVQNVGSVLAGTLKQGSLKEGDRMLVGPEEDGGFRSVTVASIHRNRTPCRMIQAGQIASISLGKDVPIAFRRGHVLLDKSLGKPTTCVEFDADMFLLFHATKISKKFQASLHIGYIFQTAVIVNMDKETLSTGQRAKVHFRFIGHPEYIRAGDRVLLREGCTKAIGDVTHIYPFTPPPAAE